MTDADAASVLVVANETLVGGELVAAVERRAAKGPIRVAVVAPVSQPRRATSCTATRGAAAGRRLERTLTELREAGIPAHGGVFEDEPLAAVKDVLASEEVDEIIVSTHLETKSGGSGRTSSRRSDGSPATGPSSTSSPTRPRAEERTSSSSRTRPCSGSRSSTASGRGRARVSELPHRVPAERPDEGGASGGRAPAPGRARDAARRGHRRPRPDRPPRPVHCRNAGGAGRADGRDHRLHLPGRAALVVAAARPRRAPSVGERPPVEHVVVERKEVEAPA